MFKYCLLILLIILTTTTIASAEEDSLSFATYYPAPYGNYREMRAMRMAIGDNYVKTNEYDWETGATNLINSNADLVVEGNVGIGTTNPGQKLDVNGQIKAIGIETATFKMPTGAQTGYVLTTDAIGNAAWATGSSSVASSLGLDPNIWPDYLVCITASTKRIFTLAGANLALTVGYHHLDAAYGIWFNPNDGTYQTNNWDGAGDCIGQSIQQLNTMGRCHAF